MEITKYWKQFGAVLALIVVLSIGTYTLVPTGEYLSCRAGNTYHSWNPTAVPNRYYCDLLDTDPIVEGKEPTQWCEKLSSGKGSRCYTMDLVAWNSPELGKEITPYDIIDITREPGSPWEDGNYCNQGCETPEDPTNCECSSVYEIKAKTFNYNKLQLDNSNFWTNFRSERSIALKDNVAKDDDWLNVWYWINKSGTCYDVEYADRTNWNFTIIKNESYTCEKWEQFNFDKPLLTNEDIKIGVTGQKKFMSVVDHVLNFRTSDQDIIQLIEYDWWYGSGTFANACQDRDTTIVSSQAGTNYGDDIQLWIGGQDISHMLLDFGVACSLVPQGATITNISLALYENAGGGGSGDVPFLVYPITSAWVETSVTWVTKPSYDTSKVLFNETIPSGWTNAWRYFSLNTTWFNQVCNNELTYNGTYWYAPADPNRRFGIVSSEHSTTSWRPKVYIEYKAPTHFQVITKNYAGALINSTVNVTNTTYHNSSATKYDGSIIFYGLGAGIYNLTATAPDYAENSTENWNENTNITLYLSLANQPPIIDNINISSSSGLNLTGDSLIGDFNATDPDADPLTNETSWFKDGSIVTALNNLMSIASGNTSVGESWIFSARVNDGVLWSDCKNSSSLSVVNAEPILNYVEMQMNATIIYKSPELFNWFDNATALRVNCTDADVTQPVGVHVNLTDRTGTLRCDGDATKDEDLWTYICPVNETINRSSTWTFRASCTDSVSGTLTNITQWVIPWGTILNVTVDYPSNNINVRQNTSFPYYGGVYIDGGEAINVSIAIDPFNQALIVTTNLERKHIQFWVIS